MNARRDPERLIHAFLMEGQIELADQVYDAVRAEIERKRQRVVIGPWRMPTMNKFLPIGLGAAAVVAAFVVGAQLLGPPAPGGAGGAPSTAPSPTPEPSPSPTPPPSPSPAAFPPPLTQTFTSQMHGISVSYPEGWIARAATEPWTDRPGVPQFLHPGYDVLQDPLNENLFLDITSQPIGSSTPDEWVAETMAASDCPATTEPIAVDGATGLFGANACATIVAVTTAGRGYWIQLYTPTSNEGFPFAPYDRAWFEEVLATVQLQPEDAVDVAPSASP